MKLMKKKNLKIQPKSKALLQYNKLKKNLKQ